MSGPPGNQTGRRVKAKVVNEQIAAMSASHTADLAVMQAQLDLMGVSNAPQAGAVIKPSVGATVGFVPAPALLLPGLVETRNSSRCLGKLTVYPQEEGWQVGRPLRARPLS